MLCESAAATFGSSELSLAFKSKEESFICLAK